jgi:alpha-ribazole phosphatase
MQIYLVRHTTVAVEKNICYGQTDVPVSENFEAEALATKQKIPTSFDVIYSSPLTRCRKLTAAITNQTPIFDERILEFNFGDWEYKPWDSISKLTFDEWMQNFATQPTPNGESLQIMYNRIANFLDELASKEFDKVLIVAHAGVIRCVWAYLLQIPLQNIFKLPVGFGEIFSFNLSAVSAENFIIQKS